MSPDIAIRAENVTKQFTLSGASGTSLKHLIVDTFLRKERKVHTAINNISFEVRKGETLGLIGHNGAGKSTLLSMIAGTMTPTSGKITTNGKISSLLELGAGFHPDLTGRENVYLYGSIMNIPRSVMKERFDSIVEFAGIGEYIDQPVRFYSSGMYVRLGFSVAVQIDPDILLIDEVLAVGDADFQKRCIRKMHEFQKAGKTLLLISHDLETVHKISNRIAYLDHGVIRDIGDPKTMIKSYEDSLPILNGQIAKPSEGWGNKDAVINKVTLLDENNIPTDKSVGTDGKLRIRIDYTSSIRIEKPVFGFRIDHSEYGAIYASNTQLHKFDIPFIEPGNGTLQIEIDSSVLQRGIYMLSVSMHSFDHKTNYHRLENVMPITIRNPGYTFEGISALDTKFSFPGK